MALDHQVYYSTYGKYSSMPDLPVIDHPVILGDGLHCWCLSTSAAADGTRESDWYKLSFAGVYPICNCKAWRRDTGCKHVHICAAQLDALCQARTARWAAERAARQEGRAAA